MSKRIEEMALADLVRLLKDRFEIHTDITDAKPYSVRFVGKPYNSFHPDCPSLRVMTHNRGNFLSPFHIRHVLDKFGIDESEFRAARQDYKDSKEKITDVTATDSGDDNAVSSSRPN